MSDTRPDIVILMTDEERAVPPYEAPEVLAWRDRALPGRAWFDEHGVSFGRHYTGSLACVPSRPTIFTGQFPDLHGVTQTDGIGKTYDDSRMRWLRPGEVPTLGNWLRAAGYDTHYDGKWHIPHADLTDASGAPLATNDDDGVAVTEGSGDAVLVRTADHGDLLGAHGGLHQKWFNLYDEATRVPFVIARIGANATEARTVSAPTSHVDLVPTLLGAAGVDIAAAAATLTESFSEAHPLPGRDLMPVVDGATPDDDRAVYLMTRDNMLEGDSGASGLARRLKRTVNPPGPLRIRVPAHVASNFEGLVVAVDGHLWKLVRSFDDPATWTEPGVRHLAANGLGGEAYRASPLDDQWELYDLTDDPTESVNRWADPDLHELRAHMRRQLKHVRTESIPERNQPWPYAVRRPPTGQDRVRLVRWALGRLGVGATV
ncbi:sulfatase-like hydrolase/transferase [Mycolicibacterium baixiangningiae]|uniref:sulfatase-like hydrolase/transferase n=1 Tax=Mycolicibacterium baixiangningiae TaxID=2761578 RepID=UPI0018670807|nr:sulfatase-like hydrolase/transferase [Mycolicibacterium baixiangningiae]